MIINSKSLVVLFLLAGCNGCQPTPAPAPPPVPVVEAGPAPVVDAAPEAVARDGSGDLCGARASTCAYVCCHGYDMGCDWAKSSPDGGTCELRCAAYTDPATAPLLRWNLTACAAAQTCGQCR